MELLNRKTYRAVVRGLERLKAQNEQDRKENPGLIPIGWGNSVRSLIEYELRQNHERCPRDLPQAVVEYLIKKGLLVRYAGDVSFPDQTLPTEEQIVANTFESLLRKTNHGNNS